MKYQRAFVLASCLFALSPIAAMAADPAPTSDTAAPAVSQSPAVSPTPAAPVAPPLPIPVPPADGTIPDLPEVVNYHIDLPQLGTVMFEKGPLSPDKTARHDKLVLRRTKDATPETVFETKGRRLMSVKSALFSNPTTPDLLLALDPGGSGGFIEFVLLGASGTNLVPLWEPDGVKGGSASFDKVDGKTVLLVDGLSFPPATNEISRMQTPYTWENGALVEGKPVMTPMPSIPLETPGTASAPAPQEKPQK